MHRLLSLVCLMLLFCIKAVCAKVDIEQLHVPPYVLRGRDVRLACGYTAIGTAVYAIKWYKGSSEFYRYLPQNSPPKKTFKVTGFTVDMSESDASAVQLRQLTPEATSSYMCEVISETPEFWTDYRRKNLTVVDEPDSPPTISGLLTSYPVNDPIRVNCTSGPALPPPTLNWYINGERVPPHLTREYRRRGSEYMWYSVLELHSEVRHMFFRGGVMKLKCSSSIGDIYWQTTETAVAQLGSANREARSQLHGSAGTVVGLRPALVLPAVLLAALVLPAVLLAVLK